MRKSLHWFAVALLVCSLWILFAPNTETFAFVKARDFRNMVGYTIIDLTTVKKSFEGDYGKIYVQIESGHVFEIDGLILRPLPLTEVVVFSKPVAPQLRAQYEGRLPEIMFYNYRFLIEDELVEATPYVE